MMYTPLARRLALVTGASALVGIGMLTGCATKEKPAETPAPSRSSSLSPTEKSVPGAITPGPQPGAGPQKTAANARPAPTALPGNG